MCFAIIVASYIHCMEVRVSSCYIKQLIEVLEFKLEGVLFIMTVMTSTPFVLFVVNLTYSCYKVGCYLLQSGY